MPAYNLIMKFLDSNLSLQELDKIFIDLQKSRVSTKEEKALVFELVENLNKKQKISSNELTILGLCYQHGDAIPANQEAAIACYKEADVLYSQALMGKIFLSQNEAKSSDSMDAVKKDFAEIKKAKNLKKIIDIFKRALQFRDLELVCDVWAELSTYKLEEILSARKLLLPNLKKWLDPNLPIRASENILSKENPVAHVDSSHTKTTIEGILKIRIFYARARLPFSFDDSHLLRFTPKACKSIDILLLLSEIDDESYFEAAVDYVNDAESQMYSFLVALANAAEYGSKYSLAASSLLGWAFRNSRWWALKICFSEVSREANSSGPTIYAVCKAGLHLQCDAERQDEIQRFLIDAAAKEKNKFFHSADFIELCQFCLQLILEKKTLVTVTYQDLDYILIQESLSRNLSDSAKKFLRTSMCASTSYRHSYLQESQLHETQHRILEEQKSSSSSSSKPIRVSVTPSANEKGRLEAESREKSGRDSLDRGFESLKFG